MLILKPCAACKTEFKTYRATKKYCSRECYISVPKSEETRRKQSAARLGKPMSDETRARMSAAWAGKPKPWLQGEKNVNFGAAAQTPEVRQRMRVARAAAGSGWTEAQCEEHRQRMLGSSNAMRGKKHTVETRAKLSSMATQRYKDGVVKVARNKISKPEKQIAAWLTGQGITFEPQYHIHNVPFWYDFYIPSLNLIIEYQGDYWHANPSTHPPGTWMRFLSQKPVQVESIWQRDADKKKCAEESGFQVLYIWERDFKKEGLDILARLFK